MSVYLAYQKKLEYFDHKNKANLVICEKNLESLRRRGHQSPESNKIWSVVQRMYNIQGRYGLAIAFKQLAVGTKLIVNVSGPILERFKIYLPEELKLKLMFQCYDWNLNIVAIIEEDGRTVYQSPENWNQKDLEDLQAALNSRKMRVTVKLTTHDENQSTRQASLPILYDGDHDPTKAMVKKALDEQIHCDFELVADNGARIRCHKLFLACQSEFFKRMFETNCVETVENACKLKQSEETVRAFIKYLYSGDLDDAKKSQPIVFNLMEMAHCYNIPYLENAMKKIILDLPITSLDVNVALLMFSFASKVEGYEDIKEKTTLLIRGKPKEVLECEALKSILKYELDTVKQLLAIGLYQ